MLARMLQAARQSLFEGRYQEAIAAYQTVLKRDPKNVDAMMHLASIVAMGGHADAALETLRSMAVSTSFLRNSTRPLGVR
jgi:cytochrome c-type biogenesis protein CcmH/NrfG